MKSKQQVYIMIRYVKLFYKPNFSCINHQHPNCAIHYNRKCSCFIFVLSSPCIIWLMEKKNCTYCFSFNLVDNDSEVIIGTSYHLSKCRSLKICLNFIMYHYTFQYVESKVALVDLAFLFFSCETAKTTLLKSCHLSI